MVSLLGRFRVMLYFATIWKEMLLVLIHHQKLLHLVNIRAFGTGHFYRPDHNHQGA